MIDPTYYQTWFEALDQTKHRYGWPIPTYIEQYMSAVLANYTDKPNWQPETSWAETLLSLQSAAAAKVLGDQALFAAAVFPNMLARKGLSDQYFVQIGRSSYSQAARINEHLFMTMSRNFEFLAQCLRQTVHNYPQLELRKQ